MRILFGSREQILVLAGVNASTFRSQVMRKMTVAAFGVSHPAARWLGWDGIAMSTRDSLVRSGMPMRQACSTVRCFWPEWSTAAAHAESGHPDQS